MGNIGQPGEACARSTGGREDFGMESGKSVNGQELHSQSFHRTFISTYLLF